MKLEETVSIYGDVLVSSVDGPGRRAVIHFAGCSIGCKGCFNEVTHPSTGEQVRRLNTDAYADELLSFIEDNELEGLTVSGGEPTDQLLSLTRLLYRMKKKKDLSVVMFTGRVYHSLKNRLIKLEADELIDVLIDGPFVETRMEERYMRGSNNQTIHFLTNRHSIEEFDNRGIEIALDKSGNMVFLGFPTKEMIEELT